MCVLDENKIHILEAMKEFSILQLKKIHRINALMGCINSQTTHNVILKRHHYEIQHIKPHWPVDHEHRKPKLNHRLVREHENSDSEREWNRPQCLAILNAN